MISIAQTNRNSNSTCFRRDNCRLCHGTDLINVFHLTPTPPANAFLQEQRLKEKQLTYPLDLYFCLNCYHLQLLHVINPDILFRNYLYVSGTSGTLARHFEDYATICIDRLKLNTKSFVIDIGSNDGTFLSFFKKRGIQVLGIDPAHSIAKQATRNGIETWPEFFDQNLIPRIQERTKYVSLISANNMFAHSDNLNSIAECIQLMLSPNSVFIFEVSYLGAIYENTLFDTIYHEHLAYHSVTSLVPFFEKNNLELFSIQRNESHGGSIRGMVQLQTGNHKADGSVQSMIKYENKLGLNRPDTWINFSKNIVKLQEELCELLLRLKDLGYTIAGYGAPAKSTTLMYHFNINQNIIDFIVDDSPLKQGLYTPGLHIPIVSSHSIYTKRPDYILILAWNFASEIMEKQKIYKENWGQFIVPLPQIKVY